MSAESGLKHTPLYESYSEGVRIEPFHGWLMPTYFKAGAMAEHRAVRTIHGVTDVSHMGELEFVGPGAEAFLEHTFTNNVKSMKEGQARYGMICDEDGVIIDDDIIYKLGKERFRMVVNASSIDTVYNWLILQSRDYPVGIRNISDETTLIALHGPRSSEIISQLAPTLLDGDLKYYNFRENVMVGGIPIAVAARTGYTGENGMEFMSGAEEGIDLWKKLISMGITPYGLWARNTLRTEPGLPLGGNDISRELDGRGINPLEAGLGKFVDLEKEFIGRDRLLKIKEEIEVGRWDRQFVSFVAVDRGIPRDEMSILAVGRKIGTVTTGIPSPTLGKGVGMGYVEPEYAKDGTIIQVDIRGTETDMKVVPFIYRGSAGRRMVAA